MLIDTTPAPLKCTCGNVLSQHEIQWDTCDICFANPSLTYQHNELVSYDRAKFIQDSEQYAYTGPQYLDDEEYTSIPSSYENYMICCKRPYHECTCNAIEAVSFEKATNLINEQLQREFTWDEFCYDLDDPDNSCFDCKFYETTDCEKTVDFVSNAYHKLEFMDSLEESITKLDTIQGASKCSDFVPFDEDFDEDLFTRENYIEIELD